MAVDIIGTLKPKNNGDFPVVEGQDVKVDEKRLPEVLEEKANKSETEQSVSSLQNQINNIINPVTQEAEVQNARIGPDGTPHDTLKERIDDDYRSLSAKIEQAKKGGLNFDIIKNQYIDRNNGNILDYDGWDRTDYINVSRYKKIYVTLETGSTNSAWYDANKEFISRATIPNEPKSEIEIPENAVYLIISRNEYYMKSLEISADEIGELHDEFYKFKAETETDISEIKESVQANPWNNNAIEALLNCFEELAWSTESGFELVQNLYNALGYIPWGKPYNYALIEGEYISKDDGSILIDAKWSRTKPLSCKGAAKITFNGNGEVFTTARYSCFYDENMNFVGNFLVSLDDVKTSTEITVPPNAVFFAVSASTKQFENLVNIIPYKE